MRLRPLGLLILLLLIVSSGFAQDESPAVPLPLRDLLAFVPDTETVQSSFITYLDFSAALSASGADWTSTEAWLENGGSRQFARRWISGPDDVNTGWLDEAERVPEIVGFDLFDLTRVLGFGRLPEAGVVWQGDFDYDAIQSALTARGYLASELNGVPALCILEGCLSQPPIDFYNSEHANLFDAAFGRNLPVLRVDDSTLVIVKEAAFSPQVADTIATGQGTLAGDPGYQTLIEALESVAGDGLLVQAQILPQDVSAFAPSIDLDAPDALRDYPRQMQSSGDDDTPYPDWAELYAYLPPFQMMALADFQDGDEQVLVLALMYEFPGDASLGAYELRERLSTFTDVARRESAVPLVEEVGGTLYDTTYISDATGYGVALVEVRYPVSDEPAALYRAINTALLSGFFYPIWNFDL